MRKITKLFENLEFHHKVILFVSEVFVTIIIARFLGYFYNVDPFIFGFELHHFDYGVILLLISVQLLLFDRDNKRYHLYFLLSAISIGLMTDELSFIRNYHTYSEVSAVQIYNGTFVTTIVIFLFISAIAGIINFLKKKK